MHSLRRPLTVSYSDEMTNEALACSFLLQRSFSRNSVVTVEVHLSDSKTWLPKIYQGLQRYRVNWNRCREMWMRLA